jgi:glycosyltransferase involved in cell wall biosynthesis
MRILFCNYEYPPLGGGGGTITSLLAQEMVKRHEVTVLTSQGPGLPTESVENGVRIIRVPVFFRNRISVANLLSMFMFIPMGIRAGKRLLSTNRFDIINTHFVLPSGPVGDVISDLGHIPNVLSVHGGDLYDPTKITSPHRYPFLRSWIRRLLKRATLVIGQSSNTIENLRRFYTPEIECIRIPLGIQNPKIKPTHRGEYGFGEDEFLMVTVGRLIPRKAVNQLISILERLNKEKVRLLIIGDGPKKQSLKQESIRRQLGNRVIFMGHVGESEKFRILRMCDLFVSTSQHEGFGLVFLEAMASGLPVICYDSGGQIDFLRDRETGYIVPLNDLHLFTKRCESLILNPELRKKMGRANEQRSEEFHITKCALRYESVFKNVLETWKKRKP